MLETNVRIISLCLSGHRKYPLGTLNEKDNEKAMEMLYKACDLAQYLGIRIIQLAGYDVFYEESTEKTKKKFIENVKIAVGYAASKGVILAFETMNTDLMNTVEKARRIIDEINSPYLQIYPDIANLINFGNYIGGETPATDLLNGEGHIVACHLKETNEKHERRIPFGSGNNHTAYAKHIQILKQLGCRLFVAEFWDDGKDYEQICKHAAEYLRQQFKMVFKEI